MQALRIALTTICIVFLMSACKKETVTTTVPPVVNPPIAAVIAPPDAFGFYVVGYFPSYRNLASVPDVKFKMCNVVNYAFATINSVGDLIISNSTHFISVRDKAKLNGAKVFISITGLEADFKSAAATAAGRTALVNKSMNIARAYQLDGIDIDWEFPRTTDGTDVTFTEFMKQLSDSCHTNRKYYLTAAITAGKYAGAVRDAIKAELLTSNYIDWFNIMSYDDFSTTAPYWQHASLALANTSMNYWVTTRGMPARKAVLGIAGYGRPSGITQTNTTLSFSEILLQGGNPLSDSATVTSGGFTNYKIYYNGIVTVKKKAMLAKQMGNGIMMWEKSHDDHGANSLLKAVCDTIGRVY
jgi:chitinase